MATSKIYTIVSERASRGSKSEFTGTVSELIDMFSYTLEVGACYQHEKGNKKINRQPKTIKGLITNLNNAKTNAAANGYSDTHYYLKEV